MDRIYLALFIALFNVQAFASEVNEPSKKINIISWWGYISKEDRDVIGKACNTSVSVDEYFSNSEFLRRWSNRSSDYDIIIHSNTIYNSVRDKLPSSFKIPSIVHKYHPVVRNKIKDLNLKNNSRLVTLGFTGFLWNKNNFSVSINHSLNQMLDQAQDKIVVILDDPMEGMQILDSLNFFKANNLSKAKKAKVIISNDMEHILASEKFAFAYHWSGGSIQHIQKFSNKLDFMVHPKLSQITADLVSLNNRSDAALCVFEYLSGQSFTLKTQNETAYFSPYGPSNFSNKILKQMYDKYFLELEKYKWLNKPETDDFKAVDNKWKALKSELNNL